MNLNSIVKGCILKRNVRQKPAASKETQEPGLNLAFSLSQSSVDFQLEQVDALDFKADSAQVSATALIGAALVLEAVLLPMNGNETTRIVQIISLLPLLTTYVVVMISANQAYKIANYKRTPAPSAFVDGYYLAMSEHQIKDKVLNALAYVFEENQKIIESKTKLINRAITWRTMEALTLVLALLIQVILTLFFHITK